MKTISIALLPLCLLLYCACGSKEIREEKTAAGPAPKTFLAAVAAAKLGNTEATRLALTEACAQNNSAACQRLGKFFDFKSLRLLAILQGPTNQTTTTIAVLHKKSQTSHALLWDGMTLVEPTEQAIKPIAQLDCQMQHLTYQDLSKEKEYDLQIVTDSGVLLDVRHVRTLAPENSHLKFAVVSSLDDGYDGDQKKMWHEVLNRKPDVLFLLGNTVFINGNSAESIWKRHADTRNTLDLFRSERLIPTFAVWDERDYGIADGDKSFALKSVSSEAFATFFPMNEILNYHRGPGVSSHFSVAGQSFFLMDDRSFRSPRAETKDSTQWGNEQENWLYRRIALNPVPTWILNGSQYFGRYHEFDSFEGRNPSSFSRFLMNARSLPCPLVFVSSSPYFSEMMRITPETLGYETFELTTGVLHARTTTGTWKAHPNSRQIAGNDEATNYLIIDSNATQRKLHFVASVYGAGAAPLYSQDLSVMK